MARLKFIADADLRRSIVMEVRRREPGIDFLTAQEGGTLGLSDPAVLAIGSKAGRVLVSSDSNTMIGHFYALVKGGGTFCPGLIIVPQELPSGRAIEELLMIWATSRPEELSNQVIWLPM
jgi:hypothetical protein